MRIFPEFMEAHSRQLSNGTVANRGYCEMAIRDEAGLQKPTRRVDEIKSDVKQGLRVELRKDGIYGPAYWNNGDTVFMAIGNTQR